MRPRRERLLVGSMLARLPSGYGGLLSAVERGSGCSAPLMVVDGRKTDGRGMRGGEVTGEIMPAGTAVVSDGTGRGESLGSRPSRMLGDDGLTGLSLEGSAKGRSNAMPTPPPPPPPNGPLGRRGGRPLGEYGGPAPSSQSKSPDKSVTEGCTYSPSPNLPPNKSSSSPNRPRLRRRNLPPG